MNYRNYFHVASLIMFAFLLLVGCKDEQEQTENTSPGNGIQFAIRIQHMPGNPNQTRNTRVSNTSDKDYRIKQDEKITILALTEEPVNSGKWNYTYMAHATLRSGPTIDGNGYVIYHYDAPVHDLSIPQRFILLANIGDYIDIRDLHPELLGKHYIDGEDPATNENSILNLLTIQNTGLWFTENTADGKAVKVEEKSVFIPMYSMPTEADIITSSTTKLNKGNDILMLRMLARIDIDNTKINSKHVLEEVYLFHRRTNGYLPHKDADWDVSNRRVTTPWEIDEKTLTQEKPWIDEDSDGKLTHQIYTFESIRTDRDLSAAIILGIRYNGDSDTTYYRVDIPTFTDDGSSTTDIRGPILRNHCYTIKVNSVSDVGEDTPEEAYYGKIKINANVLPWREVEEIEGGLGDVYNLWVSKTYITYHHSDFSGIPDSIIPFYVETSNKRGFQMTYEKPTDMFTHLKPVVTGAPTSIGSYTYPDGWRFGEPDADGTTHKVRFEFKVKKNEDEDSRFATYAFNAGNITKYVHLHQLGKSDWSNSLTVNDWENIAVHGEVGARMQLDVNTDLIYITSENDFYPYLLNITGTTLQEYTYWVADAQSDWVQTKRAGSLIGTDPEIVPLGVANGDEYKYYLRFKNTDLTGYYTSSANDGTYSGTYKGQSGIKSYVDTQNIKEGIKRRLGFVRLRLANLYKVVQVIQYDSKGLEIHAGENGVLVDQGRELIGTNALPFHKYEYTLKKGTTGFCELKIYTDRKGCGWTAELMPNKNQPWFELYPSSGEGVTDRSSPGEKLRFYVHESTPSGEVQLCIYPSASKIKYSGIWHLDEMYDVEFRPILLVIKFEE